MDSESDPPTPGFNDDGGLWMKMDTNCIKSHAESPAEADEKPRDEADVLPAVPASVRRYYSVMDDEGADDVFIPPPPPAKSDVGLLLPVGETDEETVSNSAVALSDGAADATEPGANPAGLERSHGEKQLETATSQVEEETGGTALISEESTDNIWLPENCSLSTCKGAGCPMEQCQDADEQHHQDDASGNVDTNEDTLILSEEMDRKTEEYLEEMPLSSSDGESCEYRRGPQTTLEDIFGLDKAVSEVDVDTSETDGCRGKDGAFKCSAQTEKMEEGAPQVDNEQQLVDGRSLDYNLTKHNWMRRESGSTEISNASEVVLPGREAEEGSGGIATDIQKGEQLLHRLQLLQLRHDVNMAEVPCEVAQEASGQEKDELETDLEGVREGGGGGSLISGKEKSEEDEINQKENTEKNETKDIQDKTSPLFTEEPGQEIIVSADAGDSDDHSDTCESAHLSSVNFQETSTDIPFVSTGHRFSAAETSIEKQLHEEPQRKQNLQRAGGVFNLADDPDVLEIPFKTNVDLDSLLNAAGTSQQLIDHKLKKERHLESQGELVKQRKITGGNSKGEVNQIKETKLLFEAFQQDNTEGPTRYRKPPTPLSAGHIYPSVLERTRSLEMFSLKSFPVSRAHSLRLNKAATPDRSLENLRVKSPTGGPRDKTRLSPYSKQDKHHRIYKSMEAIGSAATAFTTESILKEDTFRQKSPVLPQNPFFKLRPALALQPEVEKDIREAKEREEELQRQRSSLYGEKKQQSEDEDKAHKLPDVRHQTRGKLERVWPPPSKKDQNKSEQQEPKVHRAGGQRAPLWQRWESGLINGQPAKQKK